MPNGAMLAAAALLAIWLNCCCSMSHHSPALGGTVDSASPEAACSACVPSAAGGSCACACGAGPEPVFAPGRSCGAALGALAARATFSIADCMASGDSALPKVCSATSVARCTSSPWMVVRSRLAFSCSQPSTAFRSWMRLSTSSRSIGGVIALRPGIMPPPGRLPPALQIRRRNSKPLVKSGICPNMVAHAPWGGRQGRSFHLGWPVTGIRAAASGAGSPCLHVRRGRQSP
ncbi:hypothetical protein D3C72_1228480 [compost metagenome]